MKEGKETRKRNFDLASFQKASQDMIATNKTAYLGEWTTYYVGFRKDYDREEVNRIICGTSLGDKIGLSRYFFEKDNLYRRIVIYYATLLKYIGMLIPTPTNGSSIEQDFVTKRYGRALEYLDKINLKDFFTSCAIKVLVDGTYYGVIQEDSKDGFTVLDLDPAYCRSRYKDRQGLDLIEFDVGFFDTITDADSKSYALKIFPKEIVRWYRKWKNGKVSSRWVFVPDAIGICFPLFDGVPLLINTIPAIIDYDDTVAVNKQRDLEEIRKIITIHMPHLSDGSLVFEPDEAAVMHKAVADMMKDNPNVSVLTTYGDVDSINSKTANDSMSDSIKNMANNVYTEAGASSLLFGTEGSASLEASIQNDLAMMMVLGHKFENFINALVNRKFSNNNVRFRYMILPITYYNTEKFITATMKMASSGYSFIIPALAMGMSQKEFVTMKQFEINVLNLKEIMVPLSNAYSEPSENKGATDEGGAPEKEEIDKAPGSIARERAEDMGGSTT